MFYKLIPKHVHTKILGFVLLIIHVTFSAMHQCLSITCVFVSWQRLHRELPLSAEELEDVFDSLDTDRTGYLTLEAFSSRFSRFAAVKRHLDLHAVILILKLVCIFI